VTDEERETLNWALVCLLAFLIGMAAIAQHPEWFGDAPVAQETSDEHE
jgi:hypothetical protein